MAPDKNKKTNGEESDVSPSQRSCAARTVWTAPVKGFLIAAPHSGSGKTTVTLGMLRALRERGLSVASAKAGPDYIDPAFHGAASGRECVNIDPWAMRPEMVLKLAHDFSLGADTLVVEGMMGLFDGAADGKGSSADLAQLLGLPVVLVVDCARLSHSVAALVSGFAHFREGLELAGVILNNVASPRHEAMLRQALSVLSTPILGVLPPSPALSLPSRHLGLVQSAEHENLELFIAAAARAVEAGIDLKTLLLIGHRAGNYGKLAEIDIIPPPAQRIAVAHDQAFAFSYPHVLTGWKRAGAEIDLFSPLENEAPRIDCGMVYLPGGYPELHAARLSEANKFRAGMEAARERGAVIYGECGGYMLLGEGLVDAEGSRHRMLGFLPLETSFAERQRHLGYRRLKGAAGSPFPSRYTAHEFHYSTIERQGAGLPLFAAEDALGADLGPAGLVQGNVCGSYMHLIDLAAAP
jgi:cobyrinic acid a,c-diamide synthase